MTAKTNSICLLAVLITVIWHQNTVNFSHNPRQILWRIEATTHTPMGYFLFYFFSPSLKVCSNLTYGCNSHCHHWPFWHSWKSGWAATVTVTPLHLFSLDEWASWPASQFLFSVTSLDYCCRPPLHALVVLLGRSSRWVGGHAAKQTGGQRGGELGRRT